jgi:hypothetical protein
MPERTRPASAPSGVTLRAVAIGFALTPLNVLFLVKTTWLWGGYTGAESLFTNTVGLLFLFVLLNRWLRRARPARAFSSGELLTIYLLLTIGTGLTSSIWDLGGSITSRITYPFWGASDQNNWRDLYWPTMPDWLTVRDRGVLEGLYLGRTNPYSWQVISAWVTPALSWALLVGALMWVVLCINSIVRRRWADEEKLPFPMTILPLELTDPRSSLLGNRLFWLGLGIAAFIQAWAALASLFPTVPAIPMGFDYSVYVENNPPWSFIRYTAVSWSPWLLGLSYLIPLDLIFSLLAFDIFWTAEYVVSGHFGWSVSKWSGFPYGEQQTAGGFIALALAAVWLDRRYLAQVIRTAIGLPSPLSDQGGEALSYRGAVVGATAGIALLSWLLARTGMPGWVVAAFLAIYFIMCLVMSRLRAQLGPPTHQLYGAMPNWILPTVAGTRALGPRTMGMFLLLGAFLQEQRNHPGPAQLEAFKMAERGRMERRRIAIAMALVAPFAMLSFFWATLHVGYHTGLGTGNAQASQLSIARWAVESLDASVRNPSKPDPSGITAIGVGAAATLALYLLKLRFSWWPLHPVAFPIAIASTIQAMTPVILAAWLIKSALYRYGGLKAHRTALPFFLGLLVGDATASLVRASIWAPLGLRS